MRTAATKPAEAYDQYLGPAMFTPWGRMLLDHAQPRRGERALDLACGTGIVTHLLASMLGDDGHILGVDISEDMLEVARGKAPPDGAGITWQAGEAGALPADDGSVDLLICQHGFQFFPDKAASAREMRRVLAPGGRAVVSVWQSVDRHAVFRALFEAESQYLKVPLERLAVPFSLHDSGALRQYFLDAGFGHVDVTAQQRDVRFVDPERFITLAVSAGAAVIKDLDLSDPEQHAKLLQAVQRGAETTVAQHRQGDALCFPMHANVAVARV